MDGLISNICAIISLTSTNFFCMFSKVLVSFLKKLIKNVTRINLKILIRYFHILEKCFVLCVRSSVNKTKKSIDYLNKWINKKSKYLLIHIH